jgi:hypothetical protein
LPAVIRAGMLPRSRAKSSRTIASMPIAAQGGAMRRPVCFLTLLALLAPSAHAQLQPHRAEYALRLGSGFEAARIGRAVQDLTQDCTGWHIKRDVRTDIMLTPSLSMSLLSKLDGEENRRGFRYSTVQSQNGIERQFKGRVERQGGELRAEIVYPQSPPRQLPLPPSTLMPVAALQHLIERLRAGTGSFRALTFDAEIIHDAFLVEVTEHDLSSLRPARPIDGRLSLPEGKRRAVHVVFTRGRQDERPLFDISALAYENGVLDRLTVDTGLLSITADLQALEMRPTPSCPRS